MAFALTKVLSLTFVRTVTTELWKSPPLRGDASTPTLDSVSGLLYVPVQLTSNILYHLRRFNLLNKIFSWWVGGGSDVKWVVSYTGKISPR